MVGSNHQFLDSLEVVEFVVAVERQVVGNLVGLEEEHHMLDTHHIHQLHHRHHHIDQLNILII